MEIIGIGILFMIGIYVAPIVLGAAVVVLAVVGTFFCRVFGGCRG